MINQWMAGATYRGRTVIWSWPLLEIFLAKGQRHSPKLTARVRLCLPFPKKGMRRNLVFQAWKFEVQFFSSCQKGRPSNPGTFPQNLPFLLGSSSTKSCPVERRFFPTPFWCRDGRVPPTAKGWEEGFLSSFWRFQAWTVWTQMLD